ncbi:MAG: hypothetical protein ACR2HD_11735 [Solirubrobacteraceae bacterium]
MSIPHGWGHAGGTQRVADAHAGVNSNVLADERDVDAVSGNAVLNGITVSVTALSVTDAESQPAAAAAGTPIGA